MHYTRENNKKKQYARYGEKFMLYAPFLMFLIINIIYHMLLKVNIGDDIFLRKDPRGILEILKSVYWLWSSRLTTNVFMWSFIKQPDLVWKIADILMLQLLPILLSFLIIDYEDADTKDIMKKVWIINLLLLMYPFADMSTAGWISTTTNYLFPMVIALITLVPIKKIWSEKKIRWFEYIIYFYAVIVTSNQEQLVVFLGLGYLFFLIYWKKKSGTYNLYILISLCVCFLGLIFIFTCPGNMLRKSSEVLSWFPDFDSISIFRKIEMGFISTVKEFLIGKYVPIFTLFTGITTAAVFSTNKNIILRIVSIVPFAFSLSFGFLLNLLLPYFTSLSKFVEMMNSHNYANAMENSELILRSTFLDMLFVLMIICIVCSLQSLFANLWEKIFVSLFFLTGCGTRLVLSLSPTMFASSYRTFIFLIFTLLMCSALLLWRIRNEKVIIAITIMIGVFAGMTVVDTVAAIRYFV